MATGDPLWGGASTEPSMRASVSHDHLDRGRLPRQGVGGRGGRGDQQLRTPIMRLLMKTAIRSTSKSPLSGR